VRSDASGAQNVDALFFMLRWAWCRSLKKRVRTRYAKLVFLFPVRYPGHVVHLVLSEALNVDALFSRSGGLSVYPTRSAPGNVMLNICFCIWRVLHVM
jgi:hypothetical protein